ncbi:hypothetical protein MY8738_006312, partial [Beauveria namnaoensis]
MSADIVDFARGPGKESPPSIIVPRGSRAGDNVQMGAVAFAAANLSPSKTLRLHPPHSVDWLTSCHFAGALPGEALPPEPGEQLVAQVGDGRVQRGAPAVADHGRQRLPSDEVAAVRREPGPDTQAGHERACAQSFGVVVGGFLLGERSALDEIEGLPG